MGNLDNLLSESDFVALDFVETFEVALDGVFWVTDLASGATYEIVRSIAVANEACAHHEGGKVTDMKRIGTWVGAPIEIMRSFV